MSRYIERRAGARIEFKSPLKVKNLKSGTFSNARMVNYCDNGLYFESNSSLAEGAEIVLGIENSPYSNGSDVIDVYRAKILWRKPVQSNFYKYGYGTQLLEDSTTPRIAGGFDFTAIGGKRQEREVPQSVRVKPGANPSVWKTQSNDKMPDTAKGDMRKYPRWSCRQSVCFFSRNRQHKGVLKNVCRNGLFIETPDSLSVGQTIELKIRDRQTDKIRVLIGEIVRSGPSGVGIRVTKICDTNVQKPI